jgi:hypothetical protein
MADQQPAASKRDRLVTRPEGQLPTPKDPKKPRGEPFDPKEKPPARQAAEQNAEGIAYTA